ncbi:substrate-binding domain-containing protein [Pseudodesulfovibrio senegalensis]|uniref:Substrate-binding domain-containing protein n=1 Tax=Pseudodesulfovibrio senegalensis TaxID=1721087 RepID=A0A6N6N4U0_9BACT|nr:substrate-binding domain-containing protein [Pseudodesulfovibrio senegalensis]KAB1442798.1 substrate-binding domain-containing protein [Pseudodesulfovibrio senegalensis]
MMKYVLRGGAIIALLIFLFSTAQAAPVRVVFIPKATMPFFWQVMERSARHTAERLNVDLVWRGPRNEINLLAQRKLLTLYTRTPGTDAIVLAPSSLDDLNPEIAEAAEAGIKIVVVDSPSSSRHVSAFIATDNYHAGYKTGEYMAAKVGPDSTVMIMGYVKGNVSTDRREKGFRDAMKARAPGVTLVSSHCEKGLYRVCAQAALAGLRKYKDLAGVFAVNEISSVGLVEALGYHEGTRPGTVVIFDYNQRLEDALKDGSVDILVAQSPETMGRLGVQTALDLVEGRCVEAVKRCPVLFLDRESATEDVLKTLRLEGFSGVEASPHIMGINTPTP